MVERKPSKLDVAGSSPVSRSRKRHRAVGVTRIAGAIGVEQYEGGGRRAVAAALSMWFARVAQLVEHTLGKGEVTGSIPVASSWEWVRASVGR